MACRPGGDVDSREGKSARAETRTDDIEVFEEESGQARVPAVGLVRPAQRLSGAAPRWSYRVAPSIPEIPIPVTGAVQAVSAMPDKSHRRAAADVAAQRSRESDQESRRALADTVGLCIPARCGACRGQ